MRQGDALAFDQNPAVQEQPLRDLAAQRGWTIHHVYSDRASGAKERRPGLDALLAAARHGEFDVVVVWRFDRFARSVRQLVLALEEFHSLGIDFVSHQEALDTSTPMGRAMFTRPARASPSDAPGLSSAGTRVAELRAQGRSWRRIAAELGVGVGTVRRVFRDQAGDTGILAACQNPVAGTL
ncbi:MAG: recombinase family protein [Acidobacteria bacterium]|nr:recombinase family protein [Acidobacteriota bacterium]